MLLPIRDKNFRNCAGNLYNSVSCYVVAVDNPQVTYGDAGFPSWCRIRIEELFTISLYVSAGLWWNKWMGLAVRCGTEQWMLPHNCFYDLLRTYHREPNGWGGVSMELLVCWPGLWSRKNLCSFVGTGSLLVHNTLKPNIKKITRSKHQFSPEIAQDFRIQEIQYLSQQLTSNIYILNTCRFSKWMGLSFSVIVYVNCNSY